MDITSKSDPFVVVYMMNNIKQWYEIGRTEVIVNSQEFSFFLSYNRPKFVKKILVQYKFEEIQKLRFVVYDADTEGEATQVHLKLSVDLAGSVKTRFNRRSVLRFTQSCPLHYFEAIPDSKQGQEVRRVDYQVRTTPTIQWPLPLNPGSFRSSFSKLYRDFQYPLKLPLNSPSLVHLDEKNGITPVFKTEVTKTDHWKEIAIDVAILCNCDMVFFKFKFKITEPSFGFPCVSA